MPSTSDNKIDDAPTQIALDVITSWAILTFLSAVWFESDAYRYVGIFLVLVALTRYVVKDLRAPHRRLIGPIGILCLVWAAYVAIRFAYDHFSDRSVGTGAAEGVYLLPLLYPTFGYALFLYAQRPFWLAAAFISISGLVLLLGTDYASIMGNVRATSILHNNPIHASVGAGFIAICSISFAIHSLRRRELPKSAQCLLVAISAVTFLLALLNIFGLRSKGVWVSFGITMPIFSLLIIGTDKSRMARYVAIIGLLLAIISTCALYKNIWEVGAGTTAAVSSLAQDIASGEEILESMETAITDKTVPESMKERLRLWLNAVHIWAEQPIVGAGMPWLQQWEERKYQDSMYTLMHNGYLEIAMRYGFIGLAFYFTIFWWSTCRVVQAYRARLIDASAMQCFIGAMFFFAITILSNSNNRLAIGESYMWFSVGFGFYCYYHLQQSGYIRPRTYL